MKQINSISGKQIKAAQQSLNQGNISWADALKKEIETLVLVIPRKPENMLIAQIHKHPVRKVNQHVISVKVRIPEEFRRHIEVTIQQGHIDTWAKRRTEMFQEYLHDTYGYNT